MARKLFWLSVIATLATLFYWPLARHLASDFSNLSGDNFSFPTASFGVGDRELAWIMDQRCIIVAVISNPGGDQLPLLSRMNFINALLANPAIASMAEPYNVGRLGMGVTIFDMRTTNGNPLVMRLYFAQIGVVAIGASLPAIAIGFCTGIKRTARLHRWLRLKRERRRRANLGRCICGYDLRSSRRRCPECGRAIRIVPVVVPRV